MLLNKLEIRQKPLELVSIVRKISGIGFQPVSTESTSWKPIPRLPEEEFNEQRLAISMVRNATLLILVRIVL